MSQTLTVEEAQQMEGTEFTHIFEDGDTVPAYVKKFDAETGQLTCYSLEPKTRDGWVPRKNKDTMPDGTFCVVGSDDLDRSLSRLSTIAATGTLTLSAASAIGAGNFAGCSF